MKYRININNDVELINKISLGLWLDGYHPPYDNPNTWNFRLPWRYLLIDTSFRTYNRTDKLYLNHYPLDIADELHQCTIEGESLLLKGEPVKVKIIP